MDICGGATAKAWLEREDGCETPCSESLFHLRARIIGDHSKAPHLLALGTDYFLKGVLIATFHFYLSQKY